MESPTTQAALTPAVKARVSMRWASSPLVAKPTASGIPASRQRTRSALQTSGRYNSRSMNAAPLGLAYKRKTPIWQFARPPAVPLYCGATPADFFPFLRKPVSGTTSMPAASPRCSSTYVRRSSRTTSASQSASESSRCTPCGPRTPLAQDLGQLPAMLAFHRRQPPAQQPVHPSAHLGAPKAGPNAHLDLIERLSGLLEQLEFACIRGFAVICCAHLLLLLSAAVYPIHPLSGTVV